MKQSTILLLSIMTLATAHRIEDEKEFDDSGTPAGRRYQAKKGTALLGDLSKCVFEEGPDYIRVTCPKKQQQ